MRSLFIFRKNLRVTHHSLLNRALDESHEISFVFLLEKEPYSFPGKFLWETLEDLSESLKQKGHQLYLARSEDFNGFQWLEEFDQIYIDHQPTIYEMQFIEKLRRQDIALISSFTDRLLDESDLPFSIKEMPNVFTPFRKLIEKSGILDFLSEDRDRNEGSASWNNCAHFPLENLKAFSFDQYQFPALHKNTAIPFQGGERSGKMRVSDYLFSSMNLSSYKKTRNGMIGKDYSSKFSLWLANGSLCPRYIWSEVCRYEKEVEENSSTYWMKFELLWREYFRWLYEKYQNQFFLKRGINGKSLQTEIDQEVLQSWKEGRTSHDFINANMLELQETGYMSNRGRQNVGSYLVHHLKQDWREGARHFEELLVDNDVFSNWGNWLYIAGVGTDPRQRVFNPTKQARDYDPDLMFRSTWIS